LPTHELCGGEPAERARGNVVASVAERRQELDGARDVTLPQQAARCQHRELRRIWKTLAGLARHGFGFVDATEAQ